MALKNIKWLGNLDSNQGMTESKSVALPLGYTPIIKLLNIMGRLMGIEPTNAWITIRCVNHFATTATIIIFYLKLAGAVGIEPTLTVLETVVLPLNYAPIKMVEGGGFEPPNPKERIYSPPRLATSLPLRHNRALYIILFIKIKRSDVLLSQGETPNYHRR